MFNDSDESGQDFLLAFEDLHLADTASLELIAYVGRRLSRMPVLLILSRRRLPARAAAGRCPSPGLSRVPLPGAEDSSDQALVQRALGPHGQRLAPGAERERQIGRKVRARDDLHRSESCRAA